MEEYVAHHFDHIDSNSSDRVIDWTVLDVVGEQEESDGTEEEEETT